MEYRTWSVHIPPVYVPKTVPVPVPVPVHQCQYLTLRLVRYDFHTATGNFAKFGTIWIPVPPVLVQTFMPVPDTSVSSVRYQYRYRHFDNFSTSIPVPDTSISSVQHPYRYRAYRYRTEHTLRIFYKYTYAYTYICLLYTSPSPRDKRQSRMPSSA